MARSRLAQLRTQKHWTLEEASERIGVSVNTLSRWEQGIQIPHSYNLQRLCDAYNISELELYEEKASTEHSMLLNAASDDVLAIYAHGIGACQDLYYGGNSQQVEAILPLYTGQTALLAKQPSSLQLSAARLASHTQRLTCELATDREDFGAANQAGQQAFLYAQLADDVNLQVAALISLASLAFHRKLSVAALHSFKQAVSLLDKNVTPLLQGRTYAGLAEVYAMRQDLQNAMQAMGQAYDVYPMKPEDDPAYPYLRASRYALYVFGDAQSRLFLKQPKEADNALIAMQSETDDPQVEPITRLDMLYYQASVHIQQKELEPVCALLTEGALLAKTLGSRLYFNKLAVNYHSLQTQYPKEPSVISLEDVFQPW